MRESFRVAEGPGCHYKRSEKGVCMGGDGGGVRGVREDFTLTISAAKKSLHFSPKKE